MEGFCEQVELYIHAYMAAYTEAVCMNVRSYSHVPVATVHVIN